MKGTLFAVILALSFIVALFLNSENLVVHLLKYDKTSSLAQTIIRHVDINAYHQYFHNNAAIGSNQWLTSTTFLANDDAELAFELSLYFKDKGREQQQLLWLTKASELQHISATYLLVADLIKQEDLLKAQKLLARKFLARKDKTYHFLIEIALLTGNQMAFLNAKEDLSTLNPKSDLLSELAKVSIFNQAQIDKTDCDIRFSPVATNLKGIQRLNRLIDQSKLSRFSRYVCFDPVTYLTLEQLGCYHSLDKRIECSLEAAQNELNYLGSQYLLVMVPVGGANVNNGVLYLDHNDSVDVFYHELAHILGFIDEYALPINHVKCSDEQVPFSHNVAIIKRHSLLGSTEKQRRQLILKNVPWRDKILPSTPVYTSTSSGIKIGTPIEYKDRVGLFSTNSCSKQSNSLGIQAYKPIFQRTKMEYFELAFPAIYWQLLDDNISEFLMPAFFTEYKEAAP